MSLPSARIPDPSQKEFEEVPLIAGGEYRARLVKVEEKPNNFNPSEPQLLWSWRIVEAELEDHPLWQYTSQKMGAFEDKDSGQTKKSQARKNLEALMSRELVPGEEIDWEVDAFGLEAILSVIRKPNQAGEMRNKVVDVLPLSAVSMTTKGNVRPLPGVTPQENAPTRTSAALPESAGYLRRFEMAKHALDWTPEMINETIVAICSVNRPFHILSQFQQKAVLDVMEQAVSEADIPFDAPPTADEEDELAAAGMPAMPASAKSPASAKHRVA
jgi:hypothetical protein